jgi:hypothetical protein
MKLPGKSALPALALCLIAAASAQPLPSATSSAHLTTAEVMQAPPLDAMQPNTQRVAPIIQRFLADLDSLEHTHDIAWGPGQRAAHRALYASWLARMPQLDFATLGTEDRIDYVLFVRELKHRIALLDLEQRRYDQSRPLLPDGDALLALLEARRALQTPDPRTTAQTLQRADAALKALRQQIEDKQLTKTDPVIAYRAARILAGMQPQLKDWYGFYAGYDPDFSWWNRTPYETLDKDLTDYFALVRDKLAGASNPETIIGDPIGRDALVAELDYEMIPYTPEQLMQLAEQELAWDHAELQKAAREMGEPDWRAALEKVKADSVPPGQQPQLAFQLAHEAIDYVVDNNLVTVPPLAMQDWQATMLDAQAQLQAPFFLGGQDVWIAYPTADMPFEKKLMGMRGNNRHFSHAVVFHELIPGHHLQYFYEQRYQTQRRLFDTPFWTEGWAVYWEMLLYDRGFSKTPEDRIAQLFWRSHRAARILFSLGFHLGKMTPDQAVDLLVRQVGHEPENARAEVRRSFAGDYGPLYQAGYLIGALQFRALHHELVDSGKMTDLHFHDAILKGGPMPVEMVRARLLDQPPAKDFKAGWKFYQFAK